MAEWMEVMNQFNRMCWSYQRECKCPMACPMNGVNISQCRKIEFERSKETEEIVMSWAAEHPVVYPTWVEWMIEQGLCGADVAIITRKAYERIPADIAEKLGIEPKGDV